MASYFQTIRIVCDTQAEYDAALAQLSDHCTDAKVADRAVTSVKDQANLTLTVTYESSGTLSLYEKT